jgi:hypothetical protein
MGVSVNTAELLKILEITPEHHNIMLVGRHGIGKSRIITDYFEERGKKVVALFLGQMSDPGDIIGLPAPDAESDKTRFRPAYWFPTDGKPIVLFLDELNRARPEILQCVMDLTLNKTLAGKKLPEGSRIISAVNAGEEYQLTDLDPALLSRFNIYYFAPTVSEWLLWAAARKIDKRIIAFIEKNNDCLDEAAGDGFNKTADRRSWERVSEIIENADSIDKITEKAISGIVGVSAALKFTRSLRENTGINAQMILQNFEKHKNALEKMSAHELVPLNDGIFRIIELADGDETVRNYIKNLEAYVKWLNESQRGEVLAHWTTLFESTAYPKTKIAILTHSPYIFQSIVGFIKDIKI